jgi:hypothetical protein
VNVAVIIGSEEADEWDIRQVENAKRARAFDDKKTLTAVWAFLDDVGRTIDRYQDETASLFGPEESLSENWLVQLHADHRNVVQLSSPSPMVASSTEEALDRVFEQVILDPGQRPPGKNKQQALRAVRNAYANHIVLKDKVLHERVTLTTDRYKDRVHFSVSNGRVLQLAHTWSFQVADQDLLAEQVKSWGWTIRDVQQSGGVVQLGGGRTLEVRPDVDIEVVYIPAEEQTAPAVHDAFNVFQELGIRHLPIEQAALVGARARELLINAGVVLDLQHE